MSFKIDLQETESGNIPAVLGESMDPARLAARLKTTLRLPETGEGKAGVIPLIEDTLRFSARTWSPRFMDKLFAGANPIGAISELIVAVLNTNVHIYHVSPVFSLYVTKIPDNFADRCFIVRMEIQLMEKLASMLSFENGGGILCPGGSYSNLTAMVTARNLIFPHVKQVTRIYNEQSLIIYSST